MTGAAHRRHVLWLGCACILLLTPRADASSRSLTADFDGDGQRDWVVIDRVEPSVMHVWLSGRGTLEQIRSRRPVLQIAARDVDGDHVPELITTEEAAPPRHRLTPVHTLRVWKQDARKGFRRFRPRPPTAWATQTRGSETLHKSDPADDGADRLDGFQHPQHAAVRRGAVDADAPAGLLSRSWHADVAPTSPLSFDQSAPRPPPALHHAEPRFA